jgi:hypothetical protein
MVADGLVDSDEFEMAVNDVLWVLSHTVLGSISCIPTKRAHDTEGDALTKADSKRYVMLLFPITRSNNLYAALASLIKCC